MRPPFLIPPAELARRRQRCRPVVARLEALERRAATRCALCGGHRHALLARRDRYGFPARTALCLDCALVYVVDRFTPEGYAHFYDSSAYRDAVAAFKGRPPSLTALDRSQESYAKGLLHALGDLAEPRRGGRLLDVGGSTGVVARRVAERFDLTPTLLEPAAEEAAAARARGLAVEVGSIESWAGEGPYDLILLCRTVEHLYDLSAGLANIRRLLAPEGLFYCDIADFFEICRREGPPAAVTKVDHCFWLCQETAAAAFRRLGFEILAVHQTLPPDQVGFVLRRAEPNPEADVPRDWIADRLRWLREIDSDWRAAGRAPAGVPDRLRRAAYRLKRKLWRKRS